ASALGSSVPSRWRMISGPRNACCTVICWSSTKPISSAFGSVAMRRSASSSPLQGRSFGAAGALRFGAVVAMVTQAYRSPRGSVHHPLDPAGVASRPPASRYTARMSWLGRLFGRRADAPAPADTLTVAIPEDVAAALTADGSALGDAVVAILRGHLESIAEAVDRGDIERIPFWLARERGAD